ncbi:MAG: Ig domain-containing protein [Lachnospiraceae bacterium]|nr:Ig domain-containing protein [Lachnospiraceae bacterium]
MRLINMTCPSCGSQLQIDADNKQARCEYCGNFLLIDDGVQHVQYDNAENAGYEFEKGRQRAQQESVASQIGRQVGGRLGYVAGKVLPTGETRGYWADQPKKKQSVNPIWLWILGWLCIFPVPLTILVSRSSKLDKKWKIGIITASWIVYLLFGLFGGSGASDTSTSTTNTTNTETGNDTVRSVVDSEPATEDQGVITSISIKEDSIEVIVGNQIICKNVTVNVTDETKFSKNDIQIISDNPEIATVKAGLDSKGTNITFTIDGKSVGETSVYVKSKKGSIESNHVKVVVKEEEIIKPESISIDEEFAEIPIGDSKQVRYTVTPKGADESGLIWKSSDNNVITVDSDGLIKAVGAGTATITCSYSDNILASFDYTVDASKRSVNVKVSHTRDDDNNIGHEWSYEDLINDESISSSMLLSVGDTIRVHSKYMEEDNKPDVGEASSSHTVTEEDLLNGFEIVMELNVRENGGKNSGKSAHFVITYTFSVD